jgi:predicted regulator of Ras-like GTPase activity (Roadblock/LC7/MglB family)
VASVDAGEALDDLIRLSADVEHAAIVDDSGAVLAATSPADGDRLARTGAELLAVSAAVDPARTVDSVLVELAAGVVFVVRGDRGVAVATTGTEPIAALVLHDLRVCVESIDRRPAPKRRGNRKADPVDA